MPFVVEIEKSNKNPKDTETVPEDHSEVTLKPVHRMTIPRVEG